jgi:hypothetical protein
MPLSQAVMTFSPHPGERFVNAFNSVAGRAASNYKIAIFIFPKPNVKPSKGSDHIRTDHNR